MHGFYMATGPSSRPPYPLMELNKLWTPPSATAAARYRNTPPPRPSVRECRPSIRITCSVSSAEIEASNDDGSGLYSVYLIDLVSCDGLAQWTVRRRFSEFVALRAQLGGEAAYSLPSLPPHYAWWLGTDPRVVEERVASLGAFLQAALERWQFHSALLTFLDADDNLEPCWTGTSAAVMRVCGTAVDPPPMMARHAAPPKVKPLAEKRPSGSEEGACAEGKHALKSALKTEGMVPAMSRDGPWHTVDLDEPPPQPASPVFHTPPSSPPSKALTDHRSPDSVLEAPSCSPARLSFSLVELRVPSYAEAADAYAALAHALLAPTCSVGLVRRFVEHLCGGVVNGRLFFPPALIVCATCYLERLAPQLPLARDVLSNEDADDETTDGPDGVDAEDNAWQRVVLGLLCLASKMNSDFFDNRGFLYGWGGCVRAGWPSLSLRALGASVHTLLKMLDYRAIVTPEEFARRARAQSFVAHNAERRVGAPVRMLFG